MTNRSSVIIIGAGFSGITSAVTLQEAGITDFVILERAQKVGGTWRDAVYPGAEVDVPSCLYSLSFAPNPNWTTMNSPAPEILSYIENVVDRFDLVEHIEFGAEVSLAEFDEENGEWQITARDGRTFTAPAVIAADGLMANAQYPDIPGIDAFRGQKILSAAWNSDYDFTGKRVAVVGTGASAVQIIPELVKIAGRLLVFQRTPAWVIPRANFRFPGWVNKLFRRFPATQRAVRAALFAFYEFLTYAIVWVTPITAAAETLSKVHMRLQIKDPALRKQVTPTERIGCKRPLVTSQYFPALQRQNSQLIPHGVTEITESAVRSADGSEHEVDCIVFATGYDVGRRGSAFTVVGLDGRILGDEWSHGMVGYKSVNVAGYPNLFWTMGPNSFGHSSGLLFIEAQARYAAAGISQILTEHALVLDVKPEVQTAHNSELQRRLTRTTYNSGCQSWYLTASGFNGLMFPGSVHAYRRELTFDLGDYTVTRATGARSPQSEESSGAA